MSEHFIGVISDTHGLLRPQALAALQGVELIIHAGDIGKREVLDGLKAVAPVVAVRGNIDGEEWAKGVPMARTVGIGQVRVYVLHRTEDLVIDPIAEGCAAVISGHSHRPSILRKHGVLWVNPGAAGPRRFSLPVTLALLRVTGAQVEAELVRLEV